ncbi:MAG: hypothetical protein J5689_01270 [Clostridia bacterium]|nr:hypothetical protein [Clostridia bacterium]
MVKKKIFSFMVAIICLISCAVGLSGCRKMDRYLAVVPTDISYDATLTYHSEDTNYNYDKEWRVIRKPATICGAERDIIYVEYSYTDNKNNSDSYEEILMYVNETVLVYKNDHWEKYTSSWGNYWEWEIVYGSMAKGGSFVETLTGKVNGRDFPQDLRNETQEYIEYDFGRDNEVFRIANNIYHVLLYYNFEYQNCKTHQEATYTVGVSNYAIPSFSTITTVMIGLD